MLLAVFGWMISSRIVRGMTMSLREREFVRAARYMGVSSRRIIVRHILPNVASILIIDTTLNVGVGDPRRDRAELPGIRRPATRRVAGHADRRRHQVGDRRSRGCSCSRPASLVLIVLCANLIGDGLRDALDPGQRAAPQERRRK